MNIIPTHYDNNKKASTDVNEKQSPYKHYLRYDVSTIW